MGVVDERFDVALLDAVADARPNWRVTIVGPVVKIDPVTLPSAVLPLAVTVADPAELAAAGVTVEGNTAVFGRLLAALDEPDPDFGIVTP